MERSDHDIEPDARLTEVLIAPDDRAVLAHMTVTTSPDLVPRVCPSADAVRYAPAQPHRVEPIVYASDAAGREAPFASWQPPGAGAMAEAPKSGAASGVVAGSGDLEGGDAGRPTELAGKEVLVIDDTQVFIDGLTSAFRSKFKCRVQGATTADVGIREALSGRYAVILVDQVLEDPNWDGIGVVRHIRANGCNAVIVVLTGQSKYEAIEYALEAISAGADDYVLKDEGLEKLCWAIRMALARGPLVRVYVCGPIKLDRETRLVTVNEKPIHLPPQEFSVLFRLMRDKGKVVSREELCRFAGIQDDPTHGNLRSIIKGLRHALGSKAGKLITTEWGIGYRIAS